jgi:conjugative transfer pilus assembly protein TraH
MFLDKSELFAGDAEMRELVMSVTGTVVKSKRDGAGNLAPGNESAQPEVDWYPSLLSSTDDLLEGILRGSSAMAVYECDSTSGTYACQDVTRVTVSLPASASLIALVGERMSGLYATIQTKAEPTPEQIELVQKTSLPVHRILAVAAGLRGDAGRDLVGKYTEAVALDVLFTYLERISFNIQAQASDPQWGPHGESLADAQRDILQTLRDRRAKVHRDIDASLRIAEELQYYERLIISGMPKGLVASHRWTPSAGPL